MTENLKADSKLVKEFGLNVEQALDLFKVGIEALSLDTVLNVVTFIEKFYVIKDKYIEGKGEE